MKETMKKVTIAYEYGGNKHKADVLGKTWEELFENLMFYANDDNKIAILMPVETVEIEVDNKKDLENDDEYINSLLSGGKWGN